MRTRRTQRGGVGRILWGSVLASAAFVLVLLVADVDIPLGDEEAIQRELRERITAPAINRKIEEGLARGDVEDAAMYAELAGERGLEVRPDLHARLADAGTSSATAQRNTLEFGTGFVTGEGATIAALAGAVTSDLTVVGDVRDIAREGGLLVTGQPYDGLILGLATVGVAATGATIGTGGTALPAKLGISVLKVARRGGQLTADLAAHLGRAVRASVDFSEIGSVLKAAATLNTSATRDAASNVVRRAGTGPLSRMVGDARHIADRAGPGESVRLLRFARSPTELAELSQMSSRFGRTTRGVVELTGRTSLRAFKGGVRIARVIVENMMALIAWFGGLIGLIVTRGMTRLAWRVWKARPRRRRQGELA
jgi:hypothetical protein